MESTQCIYNQYFSKSVTLWCELGGVGWIGWIHNALHAVKVKYYFRNLCVCVGDEREYIFLTDSHSKISLKAQV